MAPVILRMDVHCYGSAEKIRRVLKKQLGVEEVWVSVDKGLVVVTGVALDAWLLKWKIQKRTKRGPVAIVSAGAGYPYYSRGMVPAAYALPAAAFPYGVGGGGWVPAASAPPQQVLRYAPSEMVHARHGQYNYYMPNDEAALWSDDDNPNGCCSVQ